MPPDPDRREKTRVLIAGGGVAALETVLALRELAAERAAVTLLAPNEDVLYRPMTVREPFAYAPAGRYELAPIARDLGAELVADRLDSVDRESRSVRTEGGLELPYDALVLALGAQPRARYAHALTIDDRHMDETLHGLVQDIEGGYLDSLAVLIPERMAWQLPAYEIALMMAGRAFDMEARLAITIVTAEPAPLALFGETVSARVAEVLDRAGVEVLTSATAETLEGGEVVVETASAAHPPRRLAPKRTIALPELYGPAVRGLPSAEHGFLPVDDHSRVRDAGPVFAAGDATDFPVKHGGLSTQQADAAAESIAALAGAPVEPQPLPSGGPRDAAHRRPAPVPDRRARRRTRAQLGGQRCADVEPADEDRGAVPRPVPRGARPRGCSRLTRCWTSRAKVGQARAARSACAASSSGHRPPVDDRVAPLVERDHLGQELGAHPVRLARDRVHAQVPVHSAALAIAMSARGRWRGSGSAGDRAQASHGPCDAVVGELGGEHVQRASRRSAACRPGAGRRRARGSRRRAPAARLRRRRPRRRRPRPAARARRRRGRARMGRTGWRSRAPATRRPGWFPRPGMSVRREAPRRRRPSRRRAPRARRRRASGPTRGPASIHVPA